MPEPIAVLRASHERFRSVVEPLGEDGVTGPSYDDEWTIADVASHLGSGAEIFALVLESALAGEQPPGGEAFPPIWDRWNATPPVEQVRRSVAVNEDFVARLEGLDEAQRTSFAVSLFGMDLDLPGLVAMRLNEHALHTWDVAVALEPTAGVQPETVPLLLGNVPAMAGRVMKQVEGGGTVTVTTTDPDQRLVLDLGAGGIADEDAEADASVVMPAEAFLRLVSGRLDPDHTPVQVQADADTLDALRRAFPGF